jgi:aryl-phospho-beta-D-glucosidase BglC (GH1 family)
MQNRIRLGVALAFVMSGVLVSALALATLEDSGAARASSPALRGVNLAGAEFGENRLPGTPGIDYTYPSASQLDYYQAKGVKLVRLPFRWERLQHCLYCTLDTAELDRIKHVVAAAGARDMQVILNPHNYARYHGNLIGSAAVPNDAYSDFWRRLAWHFRGDPAIWAYGLMNEPHDTNGLWPAAAQAGVDGIRLVDWGHTILVPGDGWSGAWTWEENNANLSVNDPANDYMFEAHQYFDRDGSGKYVSGYDAEGAYPTIGVDQVKPFTDWLNARGARGFIGEYGVPGDDPRWLVVMEHFLNYLDSHGVSSTYWAGGPWWGDYPLSIEPRDGADRPQMSILTNEQIALDPPAIDPDPAGAAELPLTGDDSSDLHDSPQNPVDPEPHAETPVPTDNEQAPVVDAPAPSGESMLVLYDDQFRNGFVDGTFNADWLNACHEGRIVTAPCSYAVSFGPWGGINFMVPGYEFDTGPYGALEFYVHTGGQELASFSVLMTAAGNGPVLREAQLRADHVQESFASGFVRVSVPMYELNPENVAIATIQIKNATNEHRNPIHVDEVRLLQA